MNKVEEKNSCRFRMTLDNVVNSIKRTFLGNNVNNNKTTNIKHSAGDVINVMFV